MPTTTGVATTFIDFTRASNATVTDSDGKVKWAPHNLLTNSESFDAAAWGSKAYVTANAAVAPNGTTTADRINNTGAADNVTQTATVSPGVAYTFSFWAKNNGGTTANYRVYDNTNFADIVAVTSYFSLINGSTWTQITVTFTAPAGCTAAPCYVTATNGPTNNVFIWGASLYRSDLGGMQPNTSAYPMYNPTTPKNLLGYSNLTAGWLTQLGATITPNDLLAPDGLYTGAKIALAADALSAAYQSVTGFGTYTISAWLRGEVGGEAVRFSYYNATNGAVNSSTITLTTTWTRYSWAGSPTANSAWYISNTSATAKTLYAWGAQLSDSASLDSYVPVYGAAVTSAAYYGPRRDFDPVTLACKGLLVEEQRANLLLYSAAFNESVHWVPSNANVVVNGIASPDGTTTGDKLEETAVSGQHLIYQTTTNANGTYTFSVWLKAAERTRAIINMSDNLTGGASIGVDLSTASTFSSGIAVGSWTAISSSITPWGNSWYRVSITGTRGAGTQTLGMIYLVSTGTTISYLGVANSGMWMYGAQLEAGSFATSYIPTGAATATRNADVASVSTQAFPYSATEGTVVANYSTILPVSTSRIVGFGTGSYASYLDISSSTAIASWNGSVNLVSASGASTVGPVKGGSAYSGTGRSLVHAGGTAATDANTFASSDALYLGSSYVANLYVLNGHIRQITYLPRRISNSELQTRTA